MEYSLREALMQSRLIAALLALFVSSVVSAQAFSQETIFMKVKIDSIVQSRETPLQTTQESEAAQTNESAAPQNEEDPFAPDLSQISPEDSAQEQLPVQQRQGLPEDSEIVVTQFSIRILDGPFKGQTKQITFKGTDTMPEYAKYKEGDVVYAGFNKIGMEDDLEEYFALYDIDNSAGIIFGCIFLLLIVIVIGRFKGLLSVLSLLLTILMIFFGFIPLVLRGFPSLLAAIIVCVVSIFITIPIITGISKKSLAAMLGASCGVVLSALIAIAFGHIMHLAGIITDEMITVFYISNINLNLKDLALSGMIIAALGAIMDVAISLSSATAEIWQANPSIEKKAAFRSVLTLGTDILGSMVNTLILAYIGSSLSLILLVSLKFDQQMPLMMVFSHNPVLVEIVKSIVGSAGMFLSIPATAYIAVQFYFKRK